MKKIYTFALDDEIPLSDDVKSNIKLIAYVLYEELHDMDYESSMPILVYNDKLIVNDLYEKKNSYGYVYNFKSEQINYDKRLFNPMMINDYTFGITVNDGTIYEEKLLELLNKIMIMLKVEYNFVINSELYFSENINDETNRFSVSKIFNQDDISKNKLIKSRKLIPLNMIIRLIGG